MLVAIVLVVYAPIVLGGKTWDDARYHTEIAPPRIAAADAVLHGDLPTWWDGSALGVPLLAEPRHGAAYPLGWIAATPRALDLFAIVHVLWLALGVAVWARRCAARTQRASDREASEPVTSDRGAGDRSAGKRGASELGALVAGALIATSGIIVSAALRGALPALAHLPWLVIAALGISSATTRRGRARHAIAAAALIALIGLAGQPIVLAHAVVLLALVGIESRGESRAKSGGGSRVSRTWPIAAWFAIAAFAGLAISCLQWLPTIATRADLAGASVHPIGVARIVELIVPLRSVEGWFPTLYCGAPLLVLATLGRPQRRFIALMGALVILALVVGPGELHIATLAILAAAHAGAGFGRVSAWLHRRLLLVLVALVPTAAALPLLFRHVDRSVVAEPPAWASAAITAQEVAVLESKAAAGAPLRVFRPIMGLDKHADDTTLADAIATFAGSSAAKWGIDAARSDDPARPAIHDRVWLAAAAAGGALLDRYGVSLAILPASMLRDDDKARIATRGRWALVRVPASPAAALVHEWIFAPDVDTVLARLFPPGASNGLASGMIVLHGQGAQNQDEPGPAEPCTIERWSRAAIDVRCSSERAAYHVVSSTAARGWSVAIDGRDTPWLVADVMRRAVALPPGEHRVAWRYWPPGLTAGLALAALGIVGLLALWLVYGRDTDAQDRTPDPPRSDAN